MSGAIARETVINGTLNCNNGGRLAGNTTIGIGRANLAGNAVVRNDATITFDVSNRSASRMQESYREAMLNSYYVAREADMTISVSSNQDSGSYILANWAGIANQKTFTLEVDGYEIGTISTNRGLSYNGKTYTLYCFDDSTRSKALTLRVTDNYRDYAMEDDASAWTVLGNGDFNGDGMEDTLLSDGSNLSGLAMFEDQQSADLWLGTLASNEEVAGIADYNNDGTDDILIHNTATDQMTAWLVKDGETYGSLAIA